MLEQALDELLKKLIPAPVWRSRVAAVAPAPTWLEMKEMLELVLDDLEKWFLLQPEYQSVGSCYSIRDERNVGAGAR
jgi:hypothetical protein